MVLDPPESPWTTYEEYMNNKFRDVNKEYHEGVDDMLALEPEPIDLIHQFPAYVCRENILRHLSLYEYYRNTMCLSGDVAELGVWKGSGFFWLAKLVDGFEPYSTTQVHGFDWFEGMDVDPERDNPDAQGTYNSSKEYLMDLIGVQGLKDVALLHDLDLSSELAEFFETHRHLRFKLVFVDCGAAEVLEESMEWFWPRLVNGGVMAFDHYGDYASPSESEIVEEFIGGRRLRNHRFSRQPTGYVVK